ncbi:hypothetical protein CVT24_002668 [Panaeolus cyanescens]|uniref:Uncharacterized protein n=1 Tax=Panaeolus cyanescens TaxID=181874 RepID=A0A409X1V2_9AGAR|nr:hypothetical protein CVT24_002668 [Panaeolus cyanescens]
MRKLMSRCSVHQASYIDADVVGGVFRILFKQDSFGSNQSYLYDEFVNAIDTAPHEHTPFSLKARHSIATDYNKEIDAVQAEIGSILKIPDITLEPNFEKNYVALSQKKEDWKGNFGRASLEYFRDGFKYQLERQGFKDDEMLQEGFAEGVPSKKIVIRVVEKTKNGSYNDTIVEEGVVYLQTTPDNWWCNVSDIGSGLLDLL